MKAIHFVLLLFLFSCKENSNNATITNTSKLSIQYDSELSFSNQDLLILKSSRHKDYYSQIADSSNSFCQLKKDTLNLYLTTGRFEGSYFLNIAIIKDTALVTFQLFDNYSKYTYDTSRLAITLNKKNVIPGEYILAKISYKSIGKLSDGHQLQYDTIAFSGIIRLKVRDNEFTYEDLAEENFKNRFYEEIKQRPDTIKRLILYTSKWMTELPKEILLYTNLEELYLDGTDLSQSNLSLLCNLNYLKILSLSECNLSAIPPCFNSLKQLEELGLSLNHLKNIPESIYELSNLKDLDIESNNISTLSPSIKKLTKLESIGLGNTNIVRLPDEMMFLNELKEIYTNDTMRYIPKLLLKYIKNDYYIQK